ncbi:MAG: TolC family protein [Odoribacteraceae bacterium]|jgi:outer membrane protein TolC|nr:TolC family protein [Odoribacteraceae bacterium]
MNTIKNTRVTLLLVALLLPATACPQKRDLAECITRAIESNFALKIKRNTAAMARENANLSPFLPSIEATARQNQATNDTRRESNSGTITRTDGVATNSYSAGVALQWRLFDGLDMFATRDRLRELESLGELTLQHEIEALVVRVCSLYYDVVVQQYRLEATRHTLALSRERYEDAQFRHGIGKISGLEARQAIVDLHADSSAHVRQEEQVKNAYIELNKTMNVNLQLTAYVRDTLVMGTPPSPDVLEKQAINNNKLLAIARGEQRISELDYRKSRALFLPTLDFSSGYNYTLTGTPAADPRLNRTNGPYWGFSATIPIFNKTLNRARARNARLEVENSAWSYRETEQELLSDLALVHNAYKSNLLVVSFESEGADIAGTNLDEALAMFKLGALSGIDFRQFQQSYINAVDRKFSAMYQAKMSELALLLISGTVAELFTSLQ